mgnify:CR=1 FL=1
MGVSPWTLLTWETGRAAPSVRLMPRIIGYLGYDLWPRPVTLGDRIAAERRRAGVSRKRLARIVGVDEATVARWERGRSVPSPAMILRLWETLRMTN